MNYEEIGKFITELRHEKNLTQKELANKLHITDKAVSKWERGLGCPDVSILEDLSIVLDVSILELLKGKKMDKEKLENNHINDYMLDTIHYSKREIKKNKNTFLLNSISILIFIICGLLLFLNIHHIIYLNSTKIYDFDSPLLLEIKDNIEKMRNNINIINHNQGIYEDNDYETIKHYLAQADLKYHEIRFLSYSGKHKMKMTDLYELSDYCYTFNVLVIYDILKKYDSHMEIRQQLSSDSSYFKSLLNTEASLIPSVSYLYKMVSHQSEMVVHVDKFNILFVELRNSMLEMVYITNQIMEVGGIYE